MSWRDNTAWPALSRISESCGIMCNLCGIQRQLSALLSTWPQHSSRYCPGVRTRGLAEHTREIGLGAETEFQRNLDQRQIAACQFLPRGLDTPIDHIAVR